MELYKLPKLKFEYDALEPFIDEQTMRVHHDGHHKDYVMKLNEALAPHPSLAKRVEELLVSIDALPKSIQKTVMNNAGGHANHSLFWTLLTPTLVEEPKGTLGTAIDKTFGSFSSFKSRFTEVSMDHFSNGWAWLCADSEGELSVFTTKDHDCPLTQNLTPLLVLDLWEHAYYLKHQNHRAEYLKTVWNVINWEEVCKRWHEVRTRGTTHREWRMTG